MYTDKIFTVENITILNEIIDSKKEIPVNLMTGVTKPKWKKLRDEITNSGKYIENRADFQNVKIIVQYGLRRTQVLNKLNKLLFEVSETVTLTLENFEEKAKQYRKKILATLNWNDEIWKKFINKFNELSLDQVNFEEITLIDIDQPIESITMLLQNIIIPDMSKKLNNELLNKLINEWNEYISYLNGYENFGKPFGELIRAVKKKDPGVYTKAYNLLSDILAKKEIYIKRCWLIEQLKMIAPAWAESIKNRDGIHGEYYLPENIELAWKWRQLSNQIARIDSYDPNTIQKELSRINELLMNNARRLAYEKAWYEKIKNKTQAQTMAIKAWQLTIKQGGQFTGKSAPMLLQKARELMPLCQTAIPVWIMPLNRVVENFDPQKNKFDVVIIDEASQAGLLALPALCLGKKIIIVGDDEQVSPVPVGIKDEEIEALRKLHLQDIPNNHLFNGKTSVYDMAQVYGFRPLMLTEHFRCLPEIIEFSNQLSYKGKIKPLRDTSGVNIKPPVIEYRVPNAYKSPNKINEIEAEHIASLICACVEDEHYQGKTIGVISLLGQEQEQAYQIDRLLQANLDPKEYKKRKIQCGTPPQFQGDARDIIFLSVVEGPSEKGGPVNLLSEDRNNAMIRKRYNVAASRAKDQMWVVHSLNPEIDLKPDDIRLKLIKHAINPSIDRNEEKLKTAESDFEKQVMHTLLNQGYKVIPQWKVGAYRIDMVIEDGDKRVALECDGEKWHTQDDLPNDLKRQAILERLGWKFIRIRGSAFYRKPEETMQWVFDELDSYGLKANFSLSVESPETEGSISNEIIECIKRRAEQIRREWHGEVVQDERKEEINEELGELTNEAAFSKEQMAESVEDKNVKTITVDSENVKSVDNVKPEPSFLSVADSSKKAKKKATSLVANQLSIDDIIEGKVKNNSLPNKPKYDFRKDRVGSKNERQATGTMRPNEKTNINELTEIEKNENKKIQKPLFDFRKK